MNRVLLIIPAYNEEESIKKVVDNIQMNFPQFDYVVINDGSRDNTLKICEENKYNCVSHPVNLGLSGAFQTGMKYACLHHYEYAIQIDADGQHDPAFIDKMVMTADEGYSIVIGSRFVTKKKPHSLRMIGSRMITAAIRLTTGVTVTDPTSGMRLYGKKVIDEFANNLNYGPEPDTVSYLIKKKNIKIKEIQVHMEDRIAGESYLSFSKSVFYMVRMLISIFLIQPAR
jgi:glycosyltransferase involved in cell wall biosynthesis